MSAAAERYLITGAQGFFGAWIIRRLVEQGTPIENILALDVAVNDGILEQVLEEPGLLGRLPRAFVDVSEYAQVKDVAEKHQPNYIIHLAGLQIPTCRENPVLGSKVNVVGTAVMFQIAKDLGCKSVVFASSAAICGPPEDYTDGRAADDDKHVPRTHYGVFKLANEGTARIFWQDAGIPSVALRPLTVFGVGREIGLTASPAKALKAAALGRGYTVGFSGTTVFHFVRDVADIFIRCAHAVTQEGKRGALKCCMAGTSMKVTDFLDVIRTQVKETLGVDADVQLSPEPVQLPFPTSFEQAQLSQLLDGDVPDTTMAESVQDTLKHFVRLRDAGRLHDRDL